MLPSNEPWQQISLFGGHLCQYLVHVTPVEAHLRKLGRLHLWPSSQGTKLRLAKALRQEQQLLWALCRVALTAILERQHWFYSVMGILDRQTEGVGHLVRLVA